MNWLKLGLAVAPFVASIVISVIIVILGFKKWIAPGINEALEEAKKTITNLAKLGGVKSQEYKDMKGIEKAVAADIITKNIPELEAIKLFLSPSTWEEIESTIENNPEAVLQLWEKYGHLLTRDKKPEQEAYMF